MKKRWLFFACVVLVACVSCAFQLQPSASDETSQGDENPPVETPPIATPADDAEATDDEEPPVIDDELDPTLIVEPEPEPEPEIVVRDWTLIVYMAADNNLESAAIADFNELESVDVSERNINVLVLFDRYDGGDATNGNWSDTRLFRVTYDAEHTNTIVSERLACPELGLSLDTSTELDMANTATLSSLIAFAGREYPAEHYGLIMWGHGTGWRGEQHAAASSAFRAYAVDDYAHTYMTISDLRVGLQSGLSTLGTNPQFDVIGFDTCFGICIETAYELRDCAGFLAGTPALVSESGWDYAALLASFAAGEKSAASFCQCALEQYRAQYAYYGYASFSVVDCTAIAQTVSAFDTFAQACADTITTASDKSTYRTLCETVVDSYHADTYACDFYVDCYSLAQTIKSYDASLAAAADAVLAACNRAIPFAWNARSDGSPRPMGVFYAVFLSETIADTVHPSAYISGSRTSNQSQFVQQCTGYVPTASRSGSLLDVLFRIAMVQ